MNIKPEEHNAFPVPPGAYDEQSRRIGSATGGMSLRAYIAIHAPLARLERPDRMHDNEWLNLIASDAVTRVYYADEMLKALNGN